MNRSPVIRLRLMNGLSFHSFVNDVLAINRVTNRFAFVEDDRPDVIVFGPYGKDLPKPGPWIRVGYFCENGVPDLHTCDYALGIPPESTIFSTKYRRIQWHGIHPESLIKPKEFSPEAVLERKDRFCNFIYSNHVPYREELFSRLSKYKRVDSPGRSMNNSPSIDTLPFADRWSVKRQFLERYKFTLALENGIAPGYQTEKLYDAMRASSLPIYIGDPLVGQIFNTQSMLCLSSVGNLSYWESVIENFTQVRFREIFGPAAMRIDIRVKRKIRRLLNDLKMKRLMAMYADAFIERIVEMDKNDDLYLNALSVPWLQGNAVPEDSYATDFWCRIFQESLSSR